MPQANVTIASEASIIESLVSIGECQAAAEEAGITTEQDSHTLS
jgi:hypothetical protein